MHELNEFTVAAIQAAPVYFDREASTDKACKLIEAAAARGAKLAAFGETWLPGYPGYAWRPMSTPGWWDAAAAYIDQAVEVPGPTTDKLCAIARRVHIDVVIGVVELDPHTRGTVYATLLFIGHEGKILGRHRKLQPTAHERIAWGQGDANGLVVYERPYGRLSGLNCWEHNMMLPGYALVAQGTQIHVAAWPGREPPAPEAPNAQWPRQHLLSRAFAAQGACYVICAGGLLQPGDMPPAFRDLVNFRYTGDSAIIDPRGEIVAVAESAKGGHPHRDVESEERSSGEVGQRYRRPLRPAGHISAARERDAGSFAPTSTAERPTARLTRRRQGRHC